MTNIAVIVAAGKGTRLKSSLPKQFIKVNGKEIIAMAAKNFESSKFIDGIVFVVSSKYKKFVEDKIIKKYKIKKVIGVINGGAERYLSVYNAIKLLEGENPKNVIIHDGARPVFSKDLIEKIIRELKYNKAVVPVRKVNQTVKMVHDSYIVSTIDRSSLRTSETPQGFNYEILKKLYNKKKIEKLKPTDEAAVFEKNRIKVKIVEDSGFNIKITTIEDIKILKAHLR